jgi:hypothetical protein
MKNTLILLSLFVPSMVMAMSCADILDKAKPAKKGKSNCVMLEHNIGIEPGSTESVYLCNGTKYTLDTNADFECTVRGSGKGGKRK